MLFQVVHTHTNETCPAQSPELSKLLGNWWRALKDNAGVTVVSAYVSPMDHTFHITVEAEDYATLALAFGPLNSFGTGHTSPVLRLDQTLAMAEGGAFRLS